MFLSNVLNCTGEFLFSVNSHSSAVNAELAGIINSHKTSAYKIYFCMLLKL